MNTNNLNAFSDCINNQQFSYGNAQQEMYQTYNGNGNVYSKLISYPKQENVQPNIMEIKQSENGYPNFSYSQNPYVQNDFNRSFSTSFSKSPNMYGANVNPNVFSSKHIRIASTQQIPSSSPEYQPSPFNRSFQSPTIKMENIQVNPCMFDNVPANLHRTSPIQMQANPIGSQFYQTYPHNPYLSFDSMPPTAHPMAQIINRNGSPIQVSMDNRSHHGEMNFNKRKNAIKRVSIHSDSVCVNCKTTKTTLWRRSNSGEPECNSCNLYFRANQRPRPANLIKKTILKRQRKKIGQYNSPVGNTCNMSQLPLDMKEFFEEQKEQ